MENFKINFNGYEVSNVDSAKIVKALSSGNKILAIKLFNESTGAGLVESKKAVEEISKSCYEVSIKKEVSHELTDEAREKINKEINKGNKIAAIKIYNEATGAGLVESKNAVEKLYTNKKG